jgi:rod shape-determining protein MreD
MALLLIPVKMPRWIQYLIAFATGFVVDIFLQSYGVQTFACVLMMFVRPYIVYWLSGRKPIKETENMLSSGNFVMMLLYTAILVLVHHLSVVLLETFSFHHLWKTLLIAVGNTIFTTSLIIALEFILLIKIKSKS